MKEASDVDPEHYAQLAVFFDRCRNVEARERHEILRALEDSQSMLAVELRELLEQAELAARGEGPFAEDNLQAARIEGLAALAGDESQSWSPERIGRYDVLRRIGEGGMGIVFEARQAEPSRKVALKVVHPMLSTPSVLKRFRRESEILGRLHHPGIAQIYETGTFDAGRGEQPFFAMELVDGVDLRTYAERADLDLSEQLELLAEVADAVQHAHDKSVIHRDLKPGNVLVDDSGRAKVLDFGIARISSDSSLVETELTRSGQLIGTLSYMAPEQLDGAGPAATGRVDVYSLGAMAYELVTGRRPHETAGLSMSAAMRLILEEDVPRAGKIRPDLRGDVETILGKALAKDPNQRYETPSEFAADVRRFTAHRPISARPPSAMYRAQRFARRHRGLVFGAGVALLAIAAGFAGVLEFANRESQALELESQAREKESEARAESEDRLAELTRMSDVVLVDEIFEQGSTLWPMRPEMVPALEDWLTRAREMFTRQASHAASLDRVRKDIVEASQEPDSSSFEDRLELAKPAERWQFETLTALLASIERLKGMYGNVSYRHDFASTVESRTLSDAPVAWPDAIAAISELEVYGGLELEPQMGLVPLGPDPNSGLWEFGDLQSGELPTRGEDGSLVFAQHPCLVFVLIPGGTFLMGAQSVDPEGPHYDPQAGSSEGPVHTVRISPFFLSKYEMTQGQWLYTSGGTLESNPSLYNPVGGSWDPVWFATPEAPSLLHPIESVSWNECSKLLSNLSFTLPSEAQWEYALRAGTSTPWFTGDTAQSLEGYVNLSDEYASGHGGEIWVRIDPWLNDGYTIHARVNTLKPNPFGLHHMTGNVWEWCQDTYGDIAYGSESDAPEPIPLDPVYRNPGSNSRVARGGSFHGTSDDARSGKRHNAAAQFQGSSLGVRPARVVE